MALAEHHHRTVPWAFNRKEAKDHGEGGSIAEWKVGAGVGIARSSPIPALVGVVFALFMVYVPNIIDGVMTAVI